MESIFRRLYNLFEQTMRRYGYRISWVPPVMNKNPQAELPFEIEFVIAHMLLTKRDIFFIQIGANDGMTNDPLYKFVKQYDWNGILVEPLPEIFEVLKNNYENRPNLKFINAAVGKSDGFRTLYTVRMDADTFSKAHQYSSFRRDVVVRQTQQVPDIAQRIVETQVRVISIDTLFREAGEKEIDILVIDTEGYDYEILKMMDLSKKPPPLIFYEHCNLDRAEMTAAAELLAAHGYRLTKDNLDTIAYRPVAAYGFRL
jgi:FkbM family methyltransferase